MSNIISTTYNKSKLGEERLMNGDEEFSILGDLIDQKILNEIIKNCKGLKYHWDCLHKSMITQQVIGSGFVAVGKTMVLSGDFKSSYGHYYNPPYEFHSWLIYKGGVIDVALPGLIETGLNFSDDQGPFLVNRKPVVLAGKPKKWMTYKVHDIIK